MTMSLVNWMRSTLRRFIETDDEAALRALLEATQSELETTQTELRSIKDDLADVKRDAQHHLDMFAMAESDIQSLQQIMQLRTKTLEIEMSNNRHLRQKLNQQLHIDARNRQTAAHLLLFAKRVFEGSSSTQLHTYWRSAFEQSGNVRPNQLPVIFAQIQSWQPHVQIH